VRDPAFQDDRNVEAFADLIRDFDAIHGAAKPDIHQDDVWLQVAGVQDGVLAVIRDRDDGIADLFQPLFQVESDQPFILDDENLNVHEVPDERIGKFEGKV
jgi:hypothetical protein